MEHTIVADCFCETDLFEKYILLWIPFMTDSNIDFLSIVIRKINFLWHICIIKMSWNVLRYMCPAEIFDTRFYKSL